MKMSERTCLILEYLQSLSWTVVQINRTSTLVFPGHLPQPGGRIGRQGQGSLFLCRPGSPGAATAVVVVLIVLVVHYLFRGLWRWVAWRAWVGGWMGWMVVPGGRHDATYHKRSLAKSPHPPCLPACLL
ncbi:hypothetical protein GE21DRAFT_1002278 [Neurospora crassa]|nr:hypothetical protein GE21DRAFT_1002278 [Neurospora crassa]